MIEYAELLDLHTRFLRAHNRDSPKDIDSMFKTWGIDPVGIQELALANEEATIVGGALGLPIGPASTFLVGLEFGIFLAQELELQKRVSHSDAD